MEDSSQIVPKGLLKGKTMHFKMTSEAESAFFLVKKELAKVTMLNHLDNSSGTRLVLKTDASQVAVGAVLQHVVKGETQPLSFFSKKLTTTETPTFILRSNMWLFGYS
nr:gag pol polyprotein [Hymenolepis microstoma]CUU98157.1 gag pol polyprotein [Hymenolepis microstoma]